MRIRIERMPSGMLRAYDEGAGLGVAATNIDALWQAVEIAMREMTDLSFHKAAEKFGKEGGE